MNMQISNWRLRTFATLVVVIVVLYSYGHHMFVYTTDWTHVRQETVQSHADAKDEDDEHGDKTNQDEEEEDDDGEEEAEEEI